MLKKILFWLGTSVGGLVLLAVIAVLVLDVFDDALLSGPVESAVSSQLGRSFAIEGELELELGWPVGLHLENIVLANVDWSSAGPMLRARAAHLRIDPLRLL